MKAKEKEMLLLKIEKARILLGSELETGFIHYNDIIKSFSKSDDYRLSGKYDYKLSVLKDIINSPFILCDQNCLDINLKKILPSILKVRYETEIEELYALYENGDISSDDLLEGKEYLKFCYYESSEEGKQILKTGKVKCVVNNTIRSR